jgi:hypothetical protein
VTATFTITAEGKVTDAKATGLPGVAACRLRHRRHRVPQAQERGLRLRDLSVHVRADRRQLIAPLPASAQRALEQAEQRLPVTLGTGSS